MPHFKVYVNGDKREIECNGDKTLLDVIRQDFGLTGTKRGCDNSGYCGTCSVIMNGKVVRSCHFPVGNLPEDARIETVEGIGTPENPHPIQKAFAYEGAIQCGYCTPGMVVVAKALLDSTVKPSEKKIRKAFRHNLCRCTGYNSIVRAVQTAGKLISGELKEADLKVDTSNGTFGKRVQRPNSLAKATGTIKYGDDLPLPPHILHLKIVRSPNHHANIKSIDISKAEALPGVAGIITAKDFPGTGILSEKKVSEWGAPVAIVAADTPEQAETAAHKVFVVYEPLPYYRTPEESLAKDTIPVVEGSKSNLGFAAKLKKGIKSEEEAEETVSKSDCIVSERFITSRQPHLTIEPDNAMAYIDEQGCITIMSKSNGIHSHLDRLAKSLKMSPEKFRWIENNSAGGFGYKNNITCEGFVALATIKFKRPSKIVYSMAETMLTTGKRSRVYISTKIGANRDGTITGMTYGFVEDCGTSSRYSKMLTNKGHTYMGGPYNIPKAYGDGKVVITNNSQTNCCGRGLGTTQVLLASEVLIDMLASKIGMDPFEFRYKNAWRENNVGNWGYKLDCYPLPGMFEKLRPHYVAAKTRAKIESSPQRRRGVGIGAGFFGCGVDNITDCSTACVELNTDGGVTVYASWADQGQGADIGIITAASKAMGGLVPEKIRVVSRDSSLVPNSGPSLASRQTVLTGNAIRLACESLLKAMKENRCLTYGDMVARNLPLKYEGKYAEQNIVPCDENSQGIPVENWSYNLQIAEVEVEIATGITTVLKITTVLDAGVIHNPLAVMGQCEGGSVEGVGFALWEDFEPGKTNTLLKGGIPNFTNFPAVECLYQETYRPYGAFGASGCGEVVMMGAGPAVVNAIHDACGIWITEFPATPARVLHKLKQDGTSVSVKQ